MTTTKREELLTMAASLLAIAEQLPDAEPVPTVSASMVTQARLSELTGYTSKRLDGMRARGDVQQNVHYFITPQNKPDWDIEAFTQWQRGRQQPSSQALPSGTVKSESKLTTKENGSANQSPYHPALAGLPKRQKCGKP